MDVMLQLKLLLIDLWLGMVIIGGLAILLVLFLLFLSIIL